jgi:hypothetical protein
MSGTTEQEAGVIATAKLVAADHHPTEAGFEGMCDGCLRGWSRLVPHPCMQAQWAANILANDDDDASS